MQKNFVSEVSALENPTVIFASKLRFVDFATQEVAPPVWVSLAADPITKLKGHFLEAKLKGKVRHQRVPFIRLSLGNAMATTSAEALLCDRKTWNK